MWDNPTLLRNIANTLMTCSLAVLLYGVGYYLVHLPGTFPLRGVQLYPLPRHTIPDQVLQAVRDSVQGNLVTIDIEHLRNDLERLPWVRTVNIRRDFPDQLVVELKEHQALAYWNDKNLVNIQGEVFDGESEDQKLLPIFIGPEGASAEMTQKYLQLNQQLIALDLQVERLTLSPRHAWQLRLSNNTVLELGRENMQQRLAIFVAVYPRNFIGNNAGDKQLQGLVKATYVDLRYRDGFAVKMDTHEKG